MTPNLKPGARVDAPVLVLRDQGHEVWGRFDRSTGVVNLFSDKGCSDSIGSATSAHAATLRRSRIFARKWIAMQIKGAA